MVATKLKQSAKRLGFVYDSIHKLYTSWLACRKRIMLYKHRERRCSYGGENPDKTFYVIGVNHTSAGLFAIVKSVYCHIFYAIQRGYIPVVNMRDFRSQLSDGVTHGNAWEAYFEQPAGYTLDDISRSKNIILSASLPYPEGVEIGFDTDLDDSFYKTYHDLYSIYIRPCESVKLYLEEKYSAVTEGKGRLLGVLCRGTDYTENRPSGHPVQPDMNQAEMKVKEVMSEYGYDHLFLATEDQKIYNHLRKQFGEKLLFSGQKLYSGMNGKRYLSEIPADSASKKWHDIVDYYATIYILSKCDGIVAGLTCGSICAYLMSDSFKYVYFWNLGRYA